MFHRAEDHAFTRILEAHVDQIRLEALAVRERMVDWQESHLHDRCWQVYGLFGFPEGQLLADQAQCCPLTTRLVADHVPSHGAAGFSLLKPRSRIAPHEGYAGRFLRCHLPLVVPHGDCGLRVGGQTRAWEEGRCMVFDDRVMHEAWNDTDQMRLVLLVDFVPGGTSIA